jgi:hypothetical protein
VLGHVVGLRTKGGVTVHESLHVGYGGYVLVLLRLSLVGIEQALDVLTEFTEVGVFIIPEMREEMRWRKGLGLTG